AGRMMDSGGQFKAQFGEDRLLHDYFHHKTSGCCVEIGANDGVTGGNTFFFDQLGGKCLLVEAIPHLAEQCRRARPNAIVANFAAVAPGNPEYVDFEMVVDYPALSSVSINPKTWRKAEFLGDAPRLRKIKVPSRTLDKILESAGISSIDFVTIDVEGHEWDVLQGFSIERWNPEVVIIERNTHWPDRRIMQFLAFRGYLYDRTTGVNDWFVRGSRAQAVSKAYRLR